MARNTKIEAAKTRGRLVSAAIEQFAQRGVAATTLDDIADAAGMTRGAVYWHFTNKLELFNDIWNKQQLVEFNIELSKEAYSNQELLECLRNELIKKLQNIAKDPLQRCLMEILLHKCEYGNGLLSEQEILNSIGFSPNAIKNTLKKYIDGENVLLGIDTDTALIIFHGCIIGIIKNWLLFPDDYNLYNKASDLVDGLLALLGIEHAGTLKI